MQPGHPRRPPGGGIRSKSVPRRRSVTGPPRSYLRSGDWPYGDVGDDVAARTAQAAARKLLEAIGGRSLREVARLADVDHTAISTFLSGSTWGDLVFLARLEHALGTRLWPDSK